MEGSTKKLQNGGDGDKEILYSKAIKAGKRIYYLDVKKNLKNDLFLAITESKRVQTKENAQSTFEKHKIFLYKEDFDKFTDGLNDVIGYIKKNNGTIDPEQQDFTPPDPLADEGGIEEIKLSIDF
ncbi:MAG: PUR family DNA/RNA-binding protein [Tannerellaceae bacterium]|nr:PUR family DNA/RNA-binding protein [Tannerellaceae bacterium]